MCLAASGPDNSLMGHFPETPGNPVRYDLRGLSCLGPLAQEGEPGWRGCRMLYLTSPSVFREALGLGVVLGSMPPTFIQPAFSDDTVLDLEDVHVQRIGDMWLLMAEHTGSWCLLSDAEAIIAGNARDCRLGHLLEMHPTLDAGGLRDFLIRLFQRGLLRLDGRAGIDPDLLSKGALFSEGNLVEILVTQKCNLACHYCLAEAGPDMPHAKPHAAYMAVDEAFALVNDAPLLIQLSGGEPFVNFRLFRSLVEYIEQKQKETTRRVRICTQSNGALVTDNIASFLKEHHVEVGVSVDGPSEVNNLTRPLLGGGASHEKTMRGIRILQRNGIAVGVIVVLSRANAGHAAEIADFLVAQDLHHVKINPVDLIGDAQRSWDSLAITSDEYFAFMETFVNHILETGLDLAESNLAAYIENLIFRKRQSRCLRSNCGAGKSFFLIDAKGDVYPCAHSANLPEWRLGTIEEAEGDLVGLGSKNPIVRQFSERLVDRLPDTKTCPWRHLCEGGCAVNAYQHHGGILAADSLCSFYERLYPRLLERLAVKPASFQRLLDLTFGADHAEVVFLDFGIDTASESSVPSESIVKDLFERRTHSAARYHLSVRPGRTVTYLNMPTVRR